MDNEFWKCKSVLVTGGLGFVGRWLVRELIALGAKVDVVDLPAAPPSAPDYGYHQLDLLDREATKVILKQLEPSVVIHLAGQAGVANCHNNPVEAFESNTICTFNLLEACRLYGRLESLVAVSSNHVYGEQETEPTAESSPLNGSGTYATSKLCADVLARCYGKTYGVPVSIARITNSFGGDDPHSSHIITGTILSALRGEKPVIKQSGKDTKGFLYVKDTVDGILVLAERTVSSSDLYGEAFNLVPDESISVGDLVRKICALINRGLDVEVREPLAPYEIEHLDNEKARQRLAWVPKYGVDGALSETLSWYEERTQAALKPSKSDHFAK